MVKKSCRKIALKFFDYAVSAVLINPFFFAALVCSILFYSGAVKVKERKPFLCLIPSENISSLNGKIASNPVKTSSGNMYSATFSVEEAISLRGEKSSSKGNVHLLIPDVLVEACYPGKLYTSSKKYGNVSLFEQGSYFELNVICLDSSENLFKVTAGKEKKIENPVLKNKISRFRGICRLQFKRLMYGWGKAGGLLLALLSGSREYTEKSLSLAFTDAGLSHILALSGMHLNLFGSLAFFFGNRFLKKSKADFFQLTAIVFFVWFAGISPSLCRALISSMLIFFNSLLKIKTADGLTVLSLTFLIQSIIFPEHIHSPAFILSYSALCGIILFGKLFKNLFSRRFFPNFASALGDSAAAQLCTAPVSLKFWGKFAPAGIISCVFVSPLVLFFLYVGAAGTVLCLFLPFLSGAFNVIMNATYSLIFYTVVFFSRFPCVNIES